MKKYYLFSDFSEKDGFSLVADDFKRDLKEYNKIVFIASNPSIGDITDKYVKKYLNWFERIGIRFKSKVVLDNRLDSKEMVNEIENASLIYLMGGATPVQMKFLNDNNLIKSIINSDCLIMGLSAGAINMCKTSVLTTTCGHDKQEVYKGIGLVGKTVEPHFTLDKFDDELKVLSYKYSIYGMCDGSAIIADKDEYIYYGDIYLLRNGIAEKVFVK